MLGAPAYRWLPARGVAEVEYRAAAWLSDAVPEAMPLP